MVIKQVAREDNAAQGNMCSNSPRMRTERHLSPTPLLLLPLLDISDPHSVSIPPQVVIPWFSPSVHPSRVRRFMLFLNKNRPRCESRNECKYQHWKTTGNARVVREESYTLSRKFYVSVRDARRISFLTFPHGDRQAGAGGRPIHLRRRRGTLGAVEAQHGDRQLRQHIQHGRTWASTWHRQGGEDRQHAHRGSSPLYCRWDRISTFPSNSR